MKSVEVEFNESNFISTIISDQFYDSWDVFLRELLQNSYDACRTRQALEWSWGTEFLELEEAEQVASVRHTFSPRIVVNYTSESGMLFVEDNGIGINEGDLINYIAHVGDSYYTSEEFAKQRLKYEPIAQFGIGLLSCFRVSRAVLIESRKDKSINTAWNIMEPASLEPIAAKWFNGAQSIEYINSNRKLVGTRVTLALLPQYAIRVTLQGLVDAINRFMVCQPIPIDVYYDKKRVTLDQPTIPTSPTSYVVGVTTLQINNDLMEGYITLFNKRHIEMVGPSELFQQGFSVCKNAEELDLKPEWLRHMAYHINLKKRFLNLKMNREGVAMDDNLRQLREMIGQIIISYYKNNPIGLAQYLNDGRANVLSEYESEMSFITQALFVTVHLKGKTLDLSVETILNGFLGQSIKIAFIQKALFDFYKKQYPRQFQTFVNSYNLICFEKNREMFTQFLAPYMVNQRYVVSDELPGITYIEMNADIHMKKSPLPYRKGYKAYPPDEIRQPVFCFVANEQSGPFHIILNQNNALVHLLEEHQDIPKVNYLREVIVENIKQRIMNGQNPWNKIIDFGGSFVDEWTSEQPMSEQAIWCLERNFPNSLNLFIHTKFDPFELKQYGLENLEFMPEDFLDWWYSPKTK